MACPQAFEAVLIDELFCGGNALALLGASLCEPYAGAAAVLVDELDRTIFDAAPVADKFYGLNTYFRFRDGFRKQSPSPVPFSCVNSIPADSNALPDGSLVRGRYRDFTLDHLDSAAPP